MYMYLYIYVRRTYAHIYMKDKEIWHLFFGRITSNVAFKFLCNIIIVGSKLFYFPGVISLMSKK